MPTAVKGTSSIVDSNVLIAYVADEGGRAGVVQSVLEDATGAARRLKSLADRLESP